MEKVPDKIIDKDLYIKVRRQIKKLYPKHSAYRSMLIIKRYKQLNGRIDETKKSGLKRWLKEDWSVVYPYLKEGKKVKCGDKRYIKKSACRPLKRVSKETPITLSELLKVFTPQQILKAIEPKNKHPQDYIMDWRNLKAKKKNI
jgi:hypothetical protein